MCPISGSQAFLPQPGSLCEVVAVSTVSVGFHRGLMSVPAGGIGILGGARPGGTHRPRPHDRRRWRLL